MLATRATVKLKHALQVIALEGGHANWPSLLAAAQAADTAASAAPDGVEAHRAEPGPLPPGGPESRRLALHVVSWVDGNGVRVDGTDAVLAYTAELARTAVDARLRAASLARCTGQAWRGDALRIGSVFGANDFRGETCALHVACAGLAEAFGVAPLVPRADAPGTLFFVATPTLPSTRIDGDDGPGSAVVGFYVRAHSVRQARRIAEGDGATVLAIHPLPDPDAWTAGVVFSYPSTLA